MSEAAPRSSGWMVSAGWDMAFIIASPLAIVPALWFLAHSTITPEQLAIPVFAFATLGHHLPGYMRAYGDRALFERFRLRFVVVPPLLFGVVLLLVQPAWFGLDFAPPATLQLLLVVWGAWHGLMQIYGFMRIYDAKQGIGHGLGQRLDMAACFAIFIAGFLYSDSRTFVLTDLAWRAGLPTFGPGALEVVRLVGAVAIGLLVLAYLANLVREGRQGHRMGAVKLCLAVATGGIYTFSGLITTNILLGAAMFEVFHAVQYLAIVWYFNRRLEDRVGESFGPLRFLFRNRWSSLVTYLAGVAAFGAIFLAMGTPGYGPIVASGDAGGALFILFSAFFVTSSLLHYYYDGFIWKLHDKNTGQDLGASGAGLSEMSVPALLHTAKWGALALVIAGLVTLETSLPADRDRLEAHSVALAALTPNVPQVRARLIPSLLASGDGARALEMAKDNVALRPRSHHAYADLARVYVARKNWSGAESAYLQALDLNPREAVYRTDLARVLGKQEDARLDDAAHAYREAMRHDPADADLGVELALVEVRRGEVTAATELFEAALAKSPGDFSLRQRLVSLLLESGEKARALEVAEVGRDLAPDAAPAHRLLGQVLMQNGQPALATGSLVHARDIDPDLAGIDYELGRAQHAAGQFRRAEASLLVARQKEQAPPNVYVLLAHIYRATDREPLGIVAKQLFIDSAPDLATGYRTLGARLAEIRDWEGAQEAYEQALTLEPNDSRTRRRLEVVRSRGKK